MYLSGHRPGDSFANEEFARRNAYDDRHEQCADGHEGTDENGFAGRDKRWVVMLWLVEFGCGGGRSRRTK